MSAPMTAPMAHPLDMGAAYTLQFTALSPTTGAVVAGVNVSQATLTVQNIGGGNLDELLKQIDIEWLNLPQQGGA